MSIRKLASGQRASNKMHPPKGESWLQEPSLGIASVQANSSDLQRSGAAATSYRGKQQESCTGAKPARERMSAHQLTRGKSNRLLRRNGSRLVESFSEFLSSRNVINRRHSRYDKMVNMRASRLHANDATIEDDILIGENYNYSDNQKLIIRQGSSGENRLVSPAMESEQAAQVMLRECYWHNQQHCQRQSCRTTVSSQPQDNLRYGQVGESYTINKTTRPVKFNDNFARPKSNKKTRALLSALFSRSHKNKASLLIDLLRAPVVLAALFSMLLVATLFTFYALSFHHAHYGGQQSCASNSSGPNTSPLSFSGRHHINSRHLNQVADMNGLENVSDTDVGGDDDEDDGDGEDDKQRHGQRNAGISVGGGSSDALERALTVQTECGSFVGALEDGSIVFKGIPYASPPVGQRRWTRPRPVWLDAELCQRNGTRLAHDYRQHCAQLSPVTRRFSGHEDCLYLDIYSPQLDQVKKLPVMVYIHGGFLAFGSSGSGQVNWMRARPSARLASELNVVLVAFNYRLQALGFMTLVQFNGPDGSEGNYGLWDQLAALNWIKRNIESFSGDPDNIVLFGPDSASALPLALASQAAAAAAAERANAAHDEQRQQQQLSRDEIPTTSDQGKHCGRPRATHDLFRAAWLTNPTVFYELPYELASQHYQRLFLNGQSPCLNWSQASTGRGSGEEKGKGRGKEIEVASTNQTLECLAKMSAEQVVRHYLGKDDPSYRLDDQNSLPIHGIFADQFVTVERELVQDSYPFGGAAIEPPQEPPNEEVQPRSSFQAPVTNQTNLSGEQSANFHNDKSASANSQTNETTTTNSIQTIGAQANQRNSNGRYKRNVVANVVTGGKDFLIGSSAQAVEYWPCPRNLAAWNWSDFKRYVATSLNSFAADTYKRASELYGVPVDQFEAEMLPQTRALLTKTTSPQTTYLSMVTDIRQICPINELALSMRNSKRRHRIRRYIVETAPSKPFPLAHKNLGAPNHRGQRTGSRQIDTSHQPRHAFHAWDLIAFFGFQFGREHSQFEPNEQDLLFQAQIRQMVKRFVHRQEDVGSEISDKKNTIGAQLYPLLLFTKNGTQEQMDATTNGGFRYKADECSMWRRHLGRSYAWIS